MKVNKRSKQTSRKTKTKTKAKPKRKVRFKSEKTGCKECIDYPGKAQDVNNLLEWIDEGAGLNEGDGLKRNEGAGLNEGDGLKEDTMVRDDRELEGLLEWIENGGKNEIQS